MAKGVSQALIFRRFRAAVAGGFFGTGTKRLWVRLNDLDHGEPSLAARRDFYCRRSADIYCPLLGRRLSGSLWLGRQLKNRSLLTLTEDCQQHDLAVRKFDRIVMGRYFLFVDLPKDRRRVVEHVL